MRLGRSGETLLWLLGPGAARSERRGPGSDCAPPCTACSCAPPTRRSAEAQPPSGQRRSGSPRRGKPDPGTQDVASRHLAAPPQLGPSGFLKVSPHSSVGELGDLGDVGGVWDLGDVGGAAGGRGLQLRDGPGSIRSLGATFGTRDRQPCRASSLATAWAPPAPCPPWLRTPPWKAGTVLVTVTATSTAVGSSGCSRSRC